MSKQQLETQLDKEKAIATILANNPEHAAYFQYFANKRPDVHSNILLQIAKEKHHTDEYFFKKSYLTKVHGVDDSTAGKILNAPVVTSQGMKHELFENFMHFIAVNPIPAPIVADYVNQWVRAGLSLNKKDKQGQTPLDYALVKNRIDCVAELEKGGIDLTALDEQGFCPLHKLVQQIKDGHSKPEVIKTWCDSGLPTGTVSKHGWTPLEFTVGLGLTDTVLKFVEAGVGTKQGSLDNGTTVLHYCVKHSKLDVIKALNNKCDFNIKDSNGNSAIKLALRDAKEDVARALATGTNLNSTDDSGKTDLHWLVENNMFAQAALAVQVGYDGNLKDNAGVSPIDLLFDSVAKEAFPATDIPVAIACINVFCDKTQAKQTDLLFDSIARGKCSMTHITMAVIESYCKAAEVAPMNVLLDSIAKGKCPINDITMDAMDQFCQKWGPSFDIEYIGKIQTSQFVEQGHKPTIAEKLVKYAIKAAELRGQAAGIADIKAVEAGNDVVGDSDTDNNPEDDIDLAGQISLEDPDLADLYS